MSLFSFLFLFFITLSGFAQEEDENLSQQIEQEKKQQIQAAVRLNEQKEKAADLTVSVLEKVKSAATSDFDFMDEKARTHIKKMIEESKIWEQSPDQIRRLIMLNVKGKPMEKVFQTFPKFLDVAVAFMRDREALSGLIDFLGKKEELKIYGLLWIGMMILGWVLRKLVVSKTRASGKNFFFKMTVNLLLSIVSIVVFYNMFEKEIGPTVSIIKQHLF